MIENINLESSSIKIGGICDKQINIHMKNVNTLKTRLIKNVKHPFKGILGLSSDLEKLEIGEDQRNILLKEFQEIIIH